ncbi:MAG: 5-methylcytosine-specific restriction enzyme B [Catillopecten margaritatus gill symbiont]|uniref:5-methylcytosine-specific restriction enzyme B n=1 Tax=Catillopecten margaritatus gill symbiont TaxID=3083288 RepID=A0AAU6PG61_9GAMM
MINEELQKKIKLLKHKKQIILQGSPGTGKTREAKEIAEEMAPNNYKLIQFHPAYSYEDFVRGIVATTTDDGQVSYKVQNKVLAEMAENANKEYKLAKDEDRKPTNFVLIIDEINRANLSSVLGELIYALEYRGEAVESMYELDGSREIVLPENLYIIGTMNTADRSVGHIDYAIRRRFAFVDVNTDESVIPKNAKSLFGEIKHLFNEYLSEEFELNDVMIGHSYFLADDLKQALKYEIKPILYEYLKDGVLTCEKDKINDLKTIQIKG